MRIAFFTNEFWPFRIGGLGTYSREMTYSLSNEGHDVEVFTVGTAEENPFPNLNPNLSVHALKTDLDSHSVVAIKNVLCYNVGLAKLILDEISKGKNYDIIAINDWLTSVTGLILVNKLSIPMFFHLHSIEQTRAYWGGSETIKTLEWLMAEKCDGIIVKSNALRDATAREGYPQSKVLVVHPGCDVNKYDPSWINEFLVDRLRAMYGVDPGDRVVLFLGRITWVKGIESLLIAFNRVLKSQKNVKLIVLGIPDEQYWPKLHQIVKEQRLANNVRFNFSYVSEEERIAHYAMSDVCVFPSFAESSGLACLEAMSMAKPVVVGANGISALREFVVASGPEQNGVYINPKDPEDLAWGIRSVLSTLSGDRLGEEGRKRVMRSLTWKHSTRRTIEIYDDFIGRQDSDRAHK
jgi:glycosyltransferase involved in cell wall biosynthesis